MTNEEARAYAASWGSYIRDGDPGSCMYGFDERFLVQSEDHRLQCIDWIENTCKPQVRTNHQHYEEDEIETLDALLEKIKMAEIA